MLNPLLKERKPNLEDEDVLYMGVYPQWDHLEVKDPRETLDYSSPALALVPLSGCPPSRQCV